MDSVYLQLLPVDEISRFIVISDALIISSTICLMEY